MAFWTGSSSKTFMTEKTQNISKSESFPKVFRDLIEVKVFLSSLQKEFIENLEATYPSLEKKSTSWFQKKISSELDILLSSSVLNKSGRFRIPANINYGKEVILTRTPGLKRPHESHPAFENYEVRFINKETGSLFIGEVKRGETDRGCIRLGVLRSESKIKQNKIQEFYKFHDRFFPIKEKIRNFIKDSYSDYEVSNVDLGKIKIAIHSQHFTLYLKDGKKKNDWENWQSEKIFGFDDFNRGWYGIVKLNLQKELVSGSSRERVCKELLKLDQIKSEIVKDLNDILISLRDENRSFRFLNKLTEK